MDVDVPELVSSLGSADESVRKMAAFKLQNNIGDPGFVDTFLAEGGLMQLRTLTLQASGNTLAYTLASLSRLLELDLGWNLIDASITEKLVMFVLSQPSVNILRGTFSILVAIVSHPADPSDHPGTFGFSALKTSLENHPEFLELIVSRLSSADHTLCVNALQLINALVRDAFTTDEAEWPKFVRRLQELGVFRAIYALMQSTGLQDLAHPVLEFQTLTKLLLRKWKEVPVDVEKKEHRRALKDIQKASISSAPRDIEENGNRAGKRPQERWKRLGFETENPAWEFEQVGYLGIIDLTDFVRKSHEGFQRLLQEQETKPPAKRCPIAKASLAVTAILYDHFEIGLADSDETQHRYIALESRSNFDKVFKPLLLQWARLHTSGLQQFVRLWETTEAEKEDFAKIEELVRILIEHVVGLAARTIEVAEVEQQMSDYSLSRLRELQMELLELTHEDAWGHHLRQVKDELHHESLQFIREQRIRCLLQGAWFPNTPDDGTADFRASPWRFARLSHNRRYLHWADFETRSTQGAEPALESLSNKVDLSVVTSVVSNVTPSSGRTSTDSDTSTLKNADNFLTSHRSHHRDEHTNTTITIHGNPRPPSSSKKHNRNQSSTNSAGKKHHQSNLSNPFGSGASHAGSSQDPALLTLRPQKSSQAAEWLDGLLMLLKQAPITAETNRLINFIGKYSLKIRLLNVRFEEEISRVGAWGRDVEIPGRDGVDDDFYYDVAGV